MKVTIIFVESKLTNIDRLELTIIDEIRKTRTIGCEDIKG
jgi:hypothetical protein